VSQLEEGRAGLRKRTITCVSGLAGFMSDALLAGKCAPRSFAL
jgi:hypothetical protein